MHSARLGSSAPGASARAATVSDSSSVNMPPYLENKRQSVDYDESEGLSDASFTSDSCSWQPIQRRIAHDDSVPSSHITPSRVLFPTNYDEGVVRTGSALYDAEDIPPCERTIPLPETTQPSPSLSDFQKLETICAKLRLRVNELEAAASAHPPPPAGPPPLPSLSVISGVNDRILSVRESLSSALSCVRQQSSSIEQVEDEAHSLQRVLGRMAEFHSDRVKKYSDQGVDANTPVLVDVGVEAVSACGQCKEYETKVAQLEEKVLRYSRSAAEAERLGEQLTSHHRGRGGKRSTGDDSVVEMMESQWGRRLESLKVKHEQVVQGYEKTIKNLLDKKQHRATPQLEICGGGESFRREVVRRSTSTSVEDYVGRENNALRQRVQELEDRLASVKRFYQMKKSERKEVGVRNNVMESFLDCVCVPPRLRSEGAADRPPVEDRDITLSDWIELLRACAGDRMLITRELLDVDYRKTSLVTRAVFERTLRGVPIDSGIIQALSGIYAYGDDQVDYKTFVSDLATRSGVFNVDIEAENETLRRHVDDLMAELKEKIESVESGNLLSSLQQANDALLRKDEELKQYKAEMNRFLVRSRSRQVRRPTISE